MSNCYSQITLAERRRLFELKQLKVPLGDIARLMGRHRSTIYREIKRNSFRDTELPEYNGYYSVVANNISKAQSARSCDFSQLEERCGSMTWGLTRKAPIGVGFRERAK